MQLLVERASEDQPWVVAGSIVVSGASCDRVFVGSNDFNQPGGKTATVDVSQDAAHTLPPAGFSPIRLEQGTPSPQDGPPIRTALHNDGTVYSAFQRWNPGSSLPNLDVNVVVVRDDDWGASNPPFQALGGLGVSVATGRFMVWNAIMGQERLGSDLAIAVDPTNSSNVWIAWCDREGGSSGTDWTLHVSRSVDRGVTWSADMRTITNVKNPSLAINSDGLLGLLYQAFTGSQWVTTLELTANAWATPAATHVLHQAPSSTPARTFLPYLGDYVRLLALGKDFFGVFCANNTPDTANFPIGVTYQRNANWSHAPTALQRRRDRGATVDRPLLLSLLAPRAPARPDHRTAAGPAQPSATLADQAATDPSGRARAAEGGDPGGLGRADRPAAVSVPPRPRSGGERERERSQEGDDRVLLVSMPFGAIERPALSLGLLQAHCDRLGVDRDTRYLTFAYADRVGLRDYLWMCSEEVPYTAFAGEWLFAEALYGSRQCADAAYVDEVLRRAWRLPRADGPCVDERARARRARAHRRRGRRTRTARHPPRACRGAPPREARGVEGRGVSRLRPRADASASLPVARFAPRGGGRAARVPRSLRRAPPDGAQRSQLARGRRARPAPGGPRRVEFTGGLLGVPFGTSAVT